MLTLGTQFAGRFKLRTRAWESPWFDNLLLDSGLDLLGTTNDLGQCLAACQVGQGTLAPSISDTALDDYLTGTANRVQFIDVSDYTGPYYVGRRAKFHFPAGTFSTQRVTEIAIAQGPNQGDTLFARVLVPHELTVLANEVLDIFYELRLYLDTGDVSYAQPIAGVDTTGLIRPARLTSVALPSDRFLSTEGLTVWDGALGDKTFIPGGSHFAASNITLDAYTPGTFYRDIRFALGTGEGNFSTGIAAVLTNSVNSEANPSFQMSFNPPIAKNAQRYLGLTLRYAWGRHAAE